MNNENYNYEISQDIDRTMYDNFINTLNEHFNTAGPLAIGAPKGGGDVFKDSGYTDRMGCFVFDRIVSDDDGVETIKGRVGGEFEAIFESVGGLYFEFDITSQGWVKTRYIDAERQIRGFDAWYDDEDADAEALRQMEERWNARLI